MPWGYPIRIYLRAAFRTRDVWPKDVKVELTPLGTSDAVPVQVEPGTDMFYVLPRVALKPNTTYRVHATWLQDDKPIVLESTFRTGKQRGQQRAELER